jgi:hypothetical protein
VFPWQLEELMQKGAVYRPSEHSPLYVLAPGWYDKQTGLSANAADFTEV